MKRVLLIAMLFAGFCVGVARAEPTGMGLGIILGEPTGLSAKYWTSDRTALDAAVAYSFLWPGYGSAIHIHGDVLFHSGSLVRPEDGFLPLYMGIGARLRFANGSGNPMRVGLRIPFGMEYVFAGVPVGLFLELVPIIELVPGASFSGNSAVGLRYYFGSND